MKRDNIVEVGIDNEGRLYIKPNNYKFRYIYQEAMDVPWDEQLGYLHGATPRKWSYLDWYYQIIKAAQEQDVNLIITNETQWINIPVDIKELILKEWLMAH